ncbi:acylphosphatase-2 isoform X1 [Tachyglossus aculeatus]|uniref:acylphosphatase-2 isoform X1 n=1 Tax=Tachyglossus aculeatus TaxID=9261 RepID=UPI0018F36220|nr:acylphosphatase-2 isoform X1 [Tachyglossus aculeatus]
MPAFPRLAASFSRLPPRLLSGAAAAAMSAAGLKSVDYEVSGRVQGVCFRMYTESEAKKMGLVGWVKNTRQGTVIGQVQGPVEKVNSITLPGACFDPSNFPEDEVCAKIKSKYFIWQQDVLQERHKQNHHRIQWPGRPGLLRLEVPALTFPELIFLTRRPSRSSITPVLASNTNGETACRLKCLVSSVTCFNP